MTRPTPSTPSYMANSTTRPSSMVIPISSGDIVIRQFQPEDAEQIHALFLEGLVYAPDSAHNVAQHRNLSSRVSCLAYLGFALGLGCLFRNNIAVRVGGGALTLGATALFVHVRRTITKFWVDVCARTRETDLGDITHFYDLPLPANPTQASEPQGPSGFWVAVIESPEDKSSEVVGYLGFDYRLNPDPSSGELRHMIVSMNHRRRRIGSLLLAAVVNHARRHAPPIETLDLAITEFQPGAWKFYENNRFSSVGTRIMKIGPLLSMTVSRLSRKVFD
ncbi:hypothetical protein MVEN_00734500 [Mycena venus]|uniref:N-acetyltransferase domain-containing protein n=1 Tax=Mycena venus TaxID=2733690 RepID=A0A8H6YKQ4_9AGAR|nr:hypothetical protein MVEN_00734500 [Mycena venus]